MENYMKEVVKVLGLELEEEFEFEDNNYIGKFTEEGLLVCTGTYWYTNFFDLTDILTGKIKIKKKPWKPKYGENYYFIFWYENGSGLNLGVDYSSFVRSYHVDQLRVAIGNCFRTKEEAEAKKYEVFKKLTNTEWRNFKERGNKNGK